MKKKWTEYVVPPRRRLIAYAVIFGGFAAWLVWLNAMPGKSYDGSAATESNALEEKLEADVTTLAVRIGERNIDHPAALKDAETFVTGELTSAGLAVTRQSFTARGTEVANVEGVKPGASRPNEIVVVGAHYDSVLGSTGADDNGSGVAALLAIARALQNEKLARTVRFVAFVNEEPPYFWHDTMGSLVYAKACKSRGDDVVHMVSLETLAYFSDEPKSQKYPPPLGVFYPSRGDFIGFVGNTSSRGDVHDAVDVFRKAARVPSEGAVYPSFVPGIGWSDQWAFWHEGYAGIMVTDTAPFRNPNYHTMQDLPASLDFKRFALVVEGVVEVVKAFATSS